MKKILVGALIASVIWGIIVYIPIEQRDTQDALTEATYKAEIIALVENHARAWESPDMELFKTTIHNDIIFAYPGRRLFYDDLIDDYVYYHEAFSDTKIYIESIIIDGEDVAVEWQFAATDNESGKRTAASDGIIGKVKDGKIVSWKEYLDGRVSRMQKVDALPLEEGEEPFPSPVGSLRNYCDIACN